MRHKDSKSNKDQANVSKAKSENMKRIIAELVKGRVRETVDDGEDRRGDEAQKDRPEGRNAPILPSGNNNVEISSKLLTLLSPVSN